MIIDFLGQFFLFFPVLSACVRRYADDATLFRCLALAPLHRLRVFICLCLFDPDRKHFGFLQICCCLCFFFNDFYDL